MKPVRFYALYTAWIIALVGFFLSLYFGEFLNYSPCALCWYQRIALFPLVWILGVACFRSDKQVVLYALPLTIWGGVVAIYQALSQAYPSLLKIGGVCGTHQDCSAPIFTLFGFLTFPALSALGFLLVGSFLFFASRE